MHTTVQNVEEGDRDHIRLLRPGQLSNIFVERDPLRSALVSLPQLVNEKASTNLGGGPGSCTGHTDPEDCISAEFTLVIRSIQLIHESIDLLQIRRYVEPLFYQRGRKDLLDIVDRGQYALAVVSASIRVPELDGFVIAFGCAGRY